MNDFMKVKNVDLRFLNPKVTVEVGLSLLLLLILTQFATAFGGHENIVRFDIQVGDPMKVDFF